MKILFALRSVPDRLQRAKDPVGLATWYRENLDFPVDDAGFIVFRWFGAGSTTWHPFPAQTEYFGPIGQQVMINYRVDDLDATLTQLRSAGAEVDEHVEEQAFGRFGWAVDPEGNRFELWQPAPGQ